MPWTEVSIMQTRAEFVALAQQEGANVRALCRRYGISPPTAYKWLARAQAGAALADRSRRPATSPRQTGQVVTAGVLALRQQHPTWGGRKLRAALLAQGVAAVPSASTITTLLRRAGQLAPPRPRLRPHWQRFEQPAPNVLWQLDFKGHHALARGRSHPLTALDDHSRFNLVLAACADEQTATVQAQLEATFRRYGLPQAILCDNGPPWGTAGAATPYSALSVWLLRLGIAVLHGRPYHPQTQGKDERFHRTFKADVLAGRLYADLATAQTAYDRWRQIYNLERPHEAVQMRPPASAYQPSPRPFPETLPPLEYPADMLVRTVLQDGTIRVQNRHWLVGTAFAGLPVGLLPDDAPDRYAVLCGAQRVQTLVLAQPP